MDVEIIETTYNTDIYIELNKEEIAMLWELAGTRKTFEAIKDDYEWEKVMRTYEYYDNIRNQYE